MAFLPTKIPENLKKFIRPASVIFGVVMLFLMLNSFSLTSRMSNDTQAGLFAVGSHVQTIYKKMFSSKTEIIDEGNHYKYLVTNQTLNEVRLFEAEKKVNELQNLLNYKASQPYKTITADIIARSVAGESSILIDQGAEEGLRAGLPVVVGDGYIIGTIISTQPHRSTVRLLRDSNSSIPSALLNGKKVMGLVSGLDSFLLFMDYIPQSEEVGSQMIVVNSGLDKNIPSGLVIGIIDSVVENATAPFKQAYVDPVIDVFDYRSVLILDPQAEIYAE